GSPEVYQSIADWVGGCFKTIGVTETKSLIKNGLNDLWNGEDEYRAAIAEEAKKLADWVVE
ncbi:MAG: hypothetical protein ACI3W6_09170, partial [Clostridia bacterium]